MKTHTWAYRWRWLALAAGALGSLGMVGCGKATKIPEPQAVQKRVALTAFQGDGACKDLESYIEDTAVLQMRTQLEAARDGVPGWGWWGGWGRLGGLEDARGAATPTAGASSAAPSAYTTTNNQVAGVDEADFVKNDGTRIFALSGERLYATKSWPAEQTAVQGSIEIEGWPQEMFLKDNTVVVFSSIYRWYPLANTAGVKCDSLDCGYYNANTVKVTVVDVSDLSNLKTQQEYFVPGMYSSARMVGSSVRVVMTDNFNFPAGFKWSPDWEENLWNDKARLAAAYDKIIASNEALIRQQTMADWAPPALLKKGGSETVVPQSCSSFAKVNAPTRLGTVSVVTLDLKTPDALDKTTILAEPGVIYASSSALYIATRHWWWWPAPGQEDVTYVHKFDITNPSAATYLTSGTVEGSIIDQFSLDEYKGNLRVASTLTTRVVDQQNPQNWWGNIETTNRVTVLGEVDGYLDVIGQSADLAKGERITSSRFINDKGFVVTYRQVDPLFTFDLSDPTNVKKVGELTIPGFSTYMQPIDDTHLISIGIYTPAAPVGGTVDWRERTLQLAIYDVSDLGHPKQTFTQKVGTAYGWSEAAYEHKAFNYFAAKKLLAIPFADWSSSYDGSGGSDGYWSTFTSDLRVYSVDVNNGFAVKGAISMRDLYQSQSSYGWTYYWTPWVRRSVIADDFVYSLSDSGIRVANIANLNAPLATTSFTRYLTK